MVIVKKQKISLPAEKPKLAAALCETAGQFAYVFAIGANAIVAAPHPTRRMSSGRPKTGRTAISTITNAQTAVTTLSARVHKLGLFALSLILTTYLALL